MIEVLAKMTKCGEDEHSDWQVDPHSERGQKSRWVARGFQQQNVDIMWSTKTHFGLYLQLG